jgi:amine acid ABC transporter, permease protein, 3-TM region, His/Glu/Gln/Arg/opine family
MPDWGISVVFEGQNFSRLLIGLLVSLRIAAVAVFFAAVGGVVLGLLMTSHCRLVRWACRLYLEAIRIIPILVWLFLFYFGLTKIFQIHLSAEIAADIVFSLWGIAEMGDLVRGAVTSMPRHQLESGMAIGLTKLQVYRHVIIPQAVRRLIPSAINLATRLIKTTSLVVLIGVVEVLKVGQQIIEVSILKTPTASFWVYAIIFLLYFIVCWPISLYSKKLERKWQS